MLRHCRKEKGSALILAMTMAVIVSAMLVGMFSLMQQRQKAGDQSDISTSGFYAAEAGLARAQFLVRRKTDEVADECWLYEQRSTDPDAMTPVTWEDGSTYFDVSGYRVRGFILDTGDSSDKYRSWYVVIVRAELIDADPTKPVPQVSLAMTMRPRDFFSRYARFVSENNLNIGTNASYLGEVHSNSDINCNGTGIYFHERVTASGDIDQNGNNPTFAKGYASGVGTVSMPESEELESLATSAGAAGKGMIFDCNDDLFRAKVAKYAPGASISPDGEGNYDNYVSVTMEIVQDKVQYRVYMKDDNDDTYIWYSSDELDDPMDTDDYAELPAGYDPEQIPYNGMIYAPGNVYVQGEVATRATIASGASVRMTGPVHYVNDSGVGQYAPHEWNEEYGEYEVDETKYDSSKREWTYTESWKGDESQQDPLIYKEREDWTAPTAASGGTAFNPCLGIVSNDDIILDTDNDYGKNPDGAMERNGEYHCYFYTSGGVVTPYDSGGDDFYNLHCLGGLATTGTNPLSGRFDFRSYQYDNKLMTNPPPYFPSAPTPVFRNWHKVGTNEITSGPDAGKYELTASNIKALFF